MGAKNGQSMRIVSSLLSLLLLGGGCDQARSQQAPAPAKSGETKPCFRCSGAGKLRCTMPGCKYGQAECPGPCLKLSKGEWVHLQVAGHSPDELWQKFPKASGGWDAWNHHHVGEVIETQNGRAVNVGKCRVCLGSTRVKCSACNGASQVTCDMCSGKKVVPSAWTDFNNPKQKTKPTLVRLKDGREIVGRIQMRIGSTVSIKTEDGKTIEVNAAEIASEQAAK